MRILMPEFQGLRPSVKINKKLICRWQMARWS